MQSTLRTLALLLLSSCQPTRPTAEPPKVPLRGVDPAPMVEVAAGEFTRGTDSGPGERDEKPARRIWLSPFAIDRHEVTVRQYRRCVKAGACSATHLDGDEGPGKSYAANKQCNWAAARSEAHPLNCVSWQQAAHYCRWVGKRLPTEAEWEKAARGPSGQTYPWGEDRPNCKRAVLIWGDKGGCGREATWPVGSLSPAGDSPYGAQDMAGNVYEWVADWYAANYYAISPQRDPRGPERGRERIVRGGSWYSYSAYLRAAFRTHLPALPNTRFVHIGFRCARSLVGSAPATAPASSPANR